MNTVESPASSKCSGGVIPGYVRLSLETIENESLGKKSATVMKRFWSSAVVDPDRFATAVRFWTFPMGFESVGWKNRECS